MLSLEAIFLTICTALDDDVEAVVPEVAKTVQEIVHQSSGVTIERLRQAKAAITHVGGKLTSVQSAFDELLKNDRDMALMNLDKVYAFPSFYDDHHSETWEMDHEEIELLIENYAQAVDGSLAKVLVMIKDIDSAMATCSLRLDTARNKLLGVDLIVNSVTSAAAVGALIAGLFGMNLESGVTEAPYWFWTIFGIIVSGIPTMVILFYFIIKSRGLLIT